MSKNKMTWALGGNYIRTLEDRNTIHSFPLESAFLIQLHGKARGGLACANHASAKKQAPKKPQQQSFLLSASHFYRLCHQCQEDHGQTICDKVWGYDSEWNNELLVCDRSNLQHVWTLHAMASTCSSSAPQENHPAGSVVYQYRTNPSLTPRQSSLLAMGCLNGRKISTPPLLTTRSLQVLSNSNSKCRKIYTHGQWH